MKNKPVIMVVEDDRLERDGLAAVLEGDGYRVVPAATGRDAVLVASSHCPDLILLNLGLPDIDGAEVLATLRSWSAVPIIAVSQRGDDDDVVALLDGGADDYVVKPYSLHVLLARVRVALRRSTITEGVVAGRRFEIGPLAIDFERRLVFLDGNAIHLTPIEYKMLTFLAKNAGRVLSYTDIRRELWGPYAGDNRLLRVNMANLRRKIEQNPTKPLLIVTEIGVGYRMNDASSYLK